MSGTVSGSVGSSAMTPANQSPSLPAGTATPTPEPNTPLPQDMPLTYSDAKQRIEATLRKQPNSYSLRMMAAEFYLKQGDSPAAIPHLQAATRLTNRSLPWIALGDAATIAGKIEIAANAYAKAEKLDPNNALVIRGQGQLLVKQKKFYAARDLLEKGLKRYPENNYIRVALANLYLVLNNAHRAAALLEPAVKSDPLLADRHYLLGEAYARDTHLEAAIREMREAARLDPTMSAAWGHLGLYLVRLTRFAEARDPLERAITIEPAEPHYYWALGDSYLLESPKPANFNRALQLYRQAINLDPLNDKALYSFAMALTRRGKPEDLAEAINLLNTLVRIRPVDVNAHYKLAETYRRVGKLEEARKHKARFLELFGKGRDENRSRYLSAAFLDTPEVHLKLGREAISRSDYAAAAREFQLALDRNPKLSAAREGLTDAQKLLGAVPGKQTAP